MADKTGRARRGAGGRRMSCALGVTPAVLRQAPVRFFSSGLLIGVLPSRGESTSCRLRLLSASSSVLRIAAALR
eukprot:CAMPEP_0172196070 /NCGR_PEP_ID=MMETSP1050-20130122/26595_1 /TAXON_ID=233186 /ORGANISM="Cryptomonas curvata, Strain CCAP979/52" /LENGTH=73 /DNA_ID=CAMNT_0012872275 /DNA_START=399 /DNA_END=617 /DNA_ORIENTATION=-